MSFYRNFLEDWLSRIEVKADLVLDIGGASRPVKNRVRSWKVANYLILDKGIEEGDYDYFFDINEEVNDIILPGLADTVFCLELMEYVFDPITAHRNISNFLKPGGILYSSYPSIYPIHQPEEIDYLRYSKRAIEKYMQLAGFKILEITSRNSTAGTEDLSSFYMREGMHPVRKSELPFHLGYMVKAKKVL